MPPRKSSRTTKKTATPKTKNTRKKSVKKVVVSGLTKTECETQNGGQYNSDTKKCSLPRSGVGIFHCKCPTYHDTCEHEYMVLGGLWFRNSATEASKNDWHLIATPDAKSDLAEAWHKKLDTKPTERKTSQKKTKSTSTKCGKLTKSGTKCKQCKPCRFHK